MRPAARFVGFRWHPAQIVVFTFGGVIVAGTLLLSLPIASATGERLRLLDAFFTAVSATCVTGLAVVDTGATFSRFGQIVILVCIQIGGLGLMVFTTIFLVATHRRLQLAQRLALEQAFLPTHAHSIGYLVGYIAGATFMTEAVAALLLGWHWWNAGHFPSFSAALYQATFHAISAFCNAGFSLFSDNLMRFPADWVTQFIISTLIIAGGLGFLVTLDLLQFWRGWRARRRMWPRRGGAFDRELGGARLTLHSKLVLITTAALLAIGTVSYFLLERNGALAGFDTGTAWLNAYFTSVTARTAGFNTVDFSKMGAAALLCTMVLMFIGASPGSTGGGVKTSTFALLVAYAYTRFRGRTRLQAFGRTVPRESRDRAGTVVVSAVALLVLAASVLVFTETRGLVGEESQRRLLPVVFETVSALGTVGLSLGITPQLSDAGRLALALVMFLGRIGPLTVALAIGRREQREHYHYAEENIMVG